jgi:type II secretory pathway pseudopilin PulG
MKLFCILLISAACASLLPAQEHQTMKAVKNRAERGTLSDQRQLVRGDSGKWNDAATLQYAPPIQQKPQGMSFDDWADELTEKKPSAKAGDDHWLLLRTRQLDDNDRVWIEKIERRGNEFIVTMHEAVWQGNYFKTFTYYEVNAVNLGKLTPGDYTVKWIVKPFAFKQLEKPREAQNNYQTNWPTDEQPAASRKTAELTVKFTVAAAK